MNGTAESVARNVAQRVIYPFAEGTWTACFAVAGALMKPRILTITPTGRDRVLVIAPHPDDETLGCGLAIAAHVQAGDSVCVAVVTDGRRSRSGGLTPDEMRIRRREEAHCAIAALGAQATLLDLAEGEWEEVRFIGAVSEALDRINPTIVYAPSTVDYHPEHRRVAVALSRLLRQQGLHECEVRAYQVQVPLGPALANATILGTDKLGRAKQRALACYISQRASLDWLDRRNRYDARLYRTHSALDLFACMGTQSYAEFVKVAWCGRFRGLRARPLADPLAWIIGWRYRVLAARAAKLRPPLN